ncbi:gamma-glutamyl-gamma-aminobutyrate hydrolase family protein [Fodinisporobacter ferrooxydans]|uniref:Gamma-glutamyl-gamma-aminobutyrate hydrolase family protein n=1 Tax=Fodinisporobacter ferrooxydans TaxID=2901836 RepID=A0ABY4CNU2_9BACL|nr:gamma-glutamyl-gamma-aminobutyrate hydrolase family protein [Alicyclobacillaceae bacterium MYW30-H2]
MDRPFIGVTGKNFQYNTEIRGVFVGEGYTKGIYAAGGMPVVIPYTDEEELLDKWVNRLDGLLLTGGEDVDPAYFHESAVNGLGEVSPDRDRLEVYLARRLLQLNKPIFGICRGIQVLNVIAGGSLYQDLPRQTKAMQHSQKAPRAHLAHDVDITSGSKLHQLLGTQTIRVNTFHHQAVKQVAPGFLISAKASDGIVEGIESRNHAFVLGVQWHPENLWEKYAVFHRLFAGFVEAAKQS